MGSSSRLFDENEEVALIIEKLKAKLNTTSVEYFKLTGGLK